MIQGQVLWRVKSSRQESRRKKGRLVLEPHATISHTNPIQSEQPRRIRRREAESKGRPFPAEAIGVDDQIAKEHEDSNGSRPGACYLEINSTTKTLLPPSEK